MQSALIPDPPRQRRARARAYRSLLSTSSRLVARRSDTIRPPDEAAGVRHCLYGFDYVDPVAKRSPGAATAYMTVEKKKIEEKK